MDDLQSEKEQIEEMKAWWAEYGRYVIAGVVIAVGLLLGPLMMTAFLTLVSIFQERYRPHVRSLTSAEVRHDPTPDAVTE